MKRIWPSHLSLEVLNGNQLNINMTKHLEIQFSEIQDGALKATMPVDHRTQQPFGMLHGGASVVLAETMGSVASNVLVHENGQMAVGIHIDANHLRSESSGLVTGICTPLHLGQQIHVWEIKVYNDANKLLCSSKLTTKILKKR